MMLHSTDAKVNFPGKSTWFLTFSKNHRRESKVLLLLLLLIHSVLHFIIFSVPDKPRKPPFSMSVSSKKNNWLIGGPQNIKVDFCGKNFKL